MCGRSAGIAGSAFLRNARYKIRPQTLSRSVGTVPAFHTATLPGPRMLMGGVSVGDDTAQAAQAAWKEIVDRLETIGQCQQVDCIIPLKAVTKGFTRLAQGPMGKVLVHVAD